MENKKSTGAKTWHEVRREYYGFGRKSGRKRSDYLFAVLCGIAAVLLALALYP